MGDKLFAFPWEALTLDEDNKQFIVNIDKDKLGNALVSIKTTGQTWRTAIWQEHL